MNQTKPDPDLQSGEPNHKEIDISELMLSPESFTAHRVSLSGKIIEITNTKHHFLVRLEVPFSRNGRIEIGEVMAQLSKNASSLTDGHEVTIRGTCEGIHIITSPNTCGVTVIPLINGDERM